jgi:hypothetical protein
LLEPRNAAGDHIAIVLPRGVDVAVETTHPVVLTSHTLSARSEDICHVAP